MERGELAARVRRAGEAGVDDALWQAARPLWRRQWLPAASQLHIDRGSPEPRGFLSAERVAFAAAGAPDEAAAIVARAEAAREGRVRFFGSPEVAVGPNPDYDRDPFTGARWPATHGKRLDYRRATHGDPKWIWELNRCQELPLLCLAWRLTGDDRFAVSAG